MYKLSVPIAVKTIERYGIDRYIPLLKEMKAERVFLALSTYIIDKDERQKKLGELKNYVTVFKNAGFEVGVWLWAFLVPDDKNYVHITSPNGAVSKEQVCPSDDKFRNFSGEFIADLAKCGPDLILFDDDYRYGFSDCGLGCACENHRKYMSELLKEDLSDSDISKDVFGGGKNKYRSAFLKANAYFLKSFAETIRKAVDGVDPSIRVGVCACMDVWDHCGISADEISVILAGKTKPFLRLIGAPYWSVSKYWGNSRLQDVIELERMESSWCRGGVEIISEGDCCPRPRFACSASRLECFDIALRATGKLDGILKYVFDYCSSPEYEKGYIDRHIENSCLYNTIDKLFPDKTECGIRVYEFKNKFENMDVPEYWKGKDDVQYSFFSAAERLASSCAFPTVYEGKGTAGIAFGENAKYLTKEDISSGLILDVVAAKILEKKGVDVGLKGVGETFFASEEFFVKTGEYVRLGGSESTAIEIKDGAVIESELICGKRTEIGSYRYENASGERFLVLAFDGNRVYETAFKQYARAEQLSDAVKWLSGNDLPAYTYGNPDVYLFCKKSENSMALFVGNFFIDRLKNVAITTDEEYKKADFYGCRGRLIGKKIVIEELPAYTCACVEVLK